MQCLYPVNTLIEHACKYVCVHTHVHMCLGLSLLLCSNICLKYFPNFLKLLPIMLFVLPIIARVTYTASTEQPTWWRVWPHETTFLEQSYSNRLWVLYRFTNNRLVYLLESRSLCTLVNFVWNVELTWVFWLFGIVNF